jgi:hypothetical protein
VAVGQFFPECFGFPCQFSFHLLLHSHHISFGAGKIGQLVADVPSGLSLTPPKETKLVANLDVTQPRPRSRWSIWSRYSTFITSPICTLIAIWFLALKTEANCQISQRNFPEDSTLHCHRRQNLRFLKGYLCCGLLGCDAVQSFRWILKFQRNVLSRVLGSLEP